jgi:hypothetical protein
MPLDYSAEAVAQKQNKAGAFWSELSDARPTNPPGYLAKEIEY